MHADMSTPKELARQSIDALLQRIVCAANDNMAGFVLAKGPAGFDKFARPGKYIACVKVVDVFDCDTSITVEIQE